MKHILKIFVLILFTTTAFAQNNDAATDEAYNKEVKLCLKNNGTHHYYSDVVDQMFVELKKQFADQNVTEDIWTELEQIKPQTLDELEDMIVTAYEGHFTLEDVKNMNALYASNAGKKMIKSDTPLTEGDKIVLQEFYKSDTGQKIVGSQDSMNAILMKITENWSGKLYRSVLDKLSEKGYNL